MLIEFSNSPSAFEILYAYQIFRLSISDYDRNSKTNQFDGIKIIDFEMIS